MKKLYFLLVVLMGFGSVSGQNIVFDDVNLKAQMLASNESNGIAFDINNNMIKVDINNDGEIQVSEALLVNKFITLSTPPISTFSSLQYFTNLKSIVIGNSELDTLDFSMIDSLKSLDCWTCNFSSINISTLDLTAINLSSSNNYSIDLSDSVSLDYLRLVNMPLTILDLSNQPLLKTLFVGNSLITTLDLSNKLILDQVSISNNQLASINVDNCPQLATLYCFNNQLISLDLSTNSMMTTLACYSNQLTTLDLTNNPLLYSISVAQNPIEQMFLKNGLFYFLNSESFPALQYLCTDEVKIPLYQNIFSGNANVQINSYCSFTPGGTYYTLQGSNTLDSNANGCDDTDMNVPNLKFNITNETQTGSFIANTSGDYSIPVQAGTHTITPVLENPTYFNISPATASVTFPEATSPFNQNFCITPNGIHLDLDVTIVPMNPAVPGFDAHYKIIYRNIGNVNIAMGTVALDYDYATLAYVSSSPVTEILPLGNLYWTFLNLQPFETRTIDVTFNLNSPTETPALIGGSLLTFQGYVETSVDEDTNPVDNVITLQQTVVNSFDPNDKTCLEGTQITPEMIGEYVHYMIRFENTGTFPAENIVVKDMIDATKFDVASLVPLNASHDYVTRITGNKVEFIFEGINLPFEDATNDGYIVFKIKTLPTLVLGDSFSNSASIYFDYNFPIVTDPAVTTFAVLGTQDFVFNNYLTVYPNPANDVLNITAKQSIELKSMEVYNMLGQLVLSVPKANGVSSVDVSNLTTGTYFLKVVSDKGTSNVKFIKK